MATRKTTPPASAIKAPATKPAAARSMTRASATTVTTVVTDSNRMLREAAWSRMFGRTESKNPFAR